LNYLFGFIGIKNYPGGKGHQTGIIIPEQQLKGSLVAVNETLYQGFFLNSIDDSHKCKIRKISIRFQILKKRIIWELKIIPAEKSQNH